MKDGDFKLPRRKPPKDLVRKIHPQKAHGKPHRPKSTKPVKPMRPMKPMKP